MRAWLRAFARDVRVVLAHLNGAANPQYKPREITEDPDTLGYRTVESPVLDWNELDQARERWSKPAPRPSYWPHDNDPED